MRDSQDPPPLGCFQEFGVALAGIATLGLVTLAAAAATDPNFAANVQRFLQGH